MQTFLRPALPAPLCSTLAPRVGAIQMRKIFCRLDKQIASKGSVRWTDPLYPFNWTRG